MLSTHERLASHRRCVERLRAGWRQFLERRGERLREHERQGGAAERLTEAILEDLLSAVLDWPLGDLNHQVGHADLIVTQFGIKRLVLEAKRPGALAWSRTAVDAALAQALRYAHEQKIHCLGISDGMMLYAADVTEGGLHDRLFVSLDAVEPPEDLWWLSADGIYRTRENAADAALRLLPEAAALDTGAALPEAGHLLHPKYQLPAQCFGYVGDANDPRSWKLPHLLVDGSVDLKRLPKAVQSVLTNYRGARVGGIPETAIPDILVRLARAAARAGRLPPACAKPAPVYVQLAEALEQLGRREDTIAAEDAGNVPRLR
ncbi:MAG: hypothetical protein ACYDCL_10150 [Myxococcales bacterium]